MSKETWEKELPHEIDFWTKWVKGKGKVENYDWSEDYYFRINPDSVIQNNIISLADPRLSKIKILDVGAGPLTVIGKKFPGKDIVIFATDPMANEYNQILDDHNIVSPVKTIYCDAENINRLPYSYFDIIYCQNALDHSYDPLKAIKSMLEILNPNGAIMLFHENNEGENEGYKDLHQWNFCEENSEFIIWQPNGFKLNITKELCHIADVKICSDETHNTVIIRLK